MAGLGWLGVTCSRRSRASDDHTSSGSSPRSPRTMIRVPQDDPGDRGQPRHGADQYNASFDATDSGDAAQACYCRRVLPNVPQGVDNLAKEDGRAKNALLFLDLAHRKWVLSGWLNRAVAQMPVNCVCPLSTTTLRSGARVRLLGLPRSSLLHLLTAVCDSTLRTDAITDSGYLEKIPVIDLAARWPFWLRKRV